MLAIRLIGIETGALAYVIALTPLLALPALVIAGAALLTRSYVLLTAAMSCLALLASLLAPRALIGSCLFGDLNRSLSVMTANLQHGLADPASVVDAVRRNKVDLLALQELTNEEVKRLNTAGLAMLLPYRIGDSGPLARGNGIWSRYPLTELAFQGGEQMPMLAATVEYRKTPSSKVRLLTFTSVHPYAPLDLKHELWTRDQPILREQLNALPGPVIVAGDFNATLDHRVMRDVQNDGYGDVSANVGHGLHATWPQGGRLGMPLVAIDHVLDRGLGETGLQPVAANTAIVAGSDHRALVAHYGDGGAKGGYGHAACLIA